MFFRNKQIMQCVSAQLSAIATPLTGTVSSKEKTDLKDSTKAMPSQIYNSYTATFITAATALLFLLSISSP